MTLARGGSVRTLSLPVAVELLAAVGALAAGAACVSTVTPAAERATCASVANASGRARRKVAISSFTALALTLLKPSSRKRRIEARELPDTPRVTVGLFVHHPGPSDHARGINEASFDGKR